MSYDDSAGRMYAPPQALAEMNREAEARLSSGKVIPRRSTSRPSSSSSDDAIALSSGETRLLQAARVKRDYTKTSPGAAPTGYGQLRRAPGTALGPSAPGRWRDAPQAGKSRRTLSGRSAVPYRVVNTRSVSCQRRPAFFRSSACRSRSSAKRVHALLR